MSIDARIRDVNRDGDTWLLSLEPRWNPHTHHFEGPGQRYLRIEEPTTWQPVPGMVVWGNSGEIVIGSAEETHHYERISTSRLREKPQ